MFQAIRRRMHFSPATVIASLALVFAMTGGAFAAGRYLITSTKQISPKVLKSLQGKAGANGANGAQGPAGPAGPAGVAGAKGETGAAGTNGTDGTNGTSVTSAESKTGKIGPCASGGSEFKSAGGTTYACNGSTGKNGTFEGQSLPAGKTLTGAWAAASYAEVAFGGVAQGAVSFPLPVRPGIQQSHLKQIGPGEGEGEGKEKLPEEEVNGKTIKVCTGNGEKPAAAEGYLCIFVVSETNVSHPMSFILAGNGEAGIGFQVTAFGAAKGPILLNGTWAVTGE